MVVVLGWLYVHFGKFPMMAGVLYGMKPVVIAVVLQALAARAIEIRRIPGEPVTRLFVSCQAENSGRWHSAERICNSLSTGNAEGHAFAPLAQSMHVLALRLIRIGTSGEHQSEAHQDAVDRLSRLPGLSIDSAQQVIAEIGPRDAMTRYLHRITPASAQASR